MFANDSFDRWYCDPPYNEENALKMYNSKAIKTKFFKKGARVFEKNSITFLLHRAVNYQTFPEEFERVGVIIITVVSSKEHNFEYLALLIVNNIELTCTVGESKCYFFDNYILHRRMARRQFSSSFSLLKFFII